MNVDECKFNIIFLCVCVCVRVVRLRCEYGKKMNKKKRNIPAKENEDLPRIDMVCIYIEVYMVYTYVNFVRLMYLDFVHNSVI